MTRGLRFTENQLSDMVRRTRPIIGAAKYRNVKTDGFDSKKESRRYADLLLLERAGDIQNLRSQVPYACVVNGIHVCDYVADFSYTEGARRVVEDVKSEHTRKLPVYRLKRRLMLACHGIQISET